MAYSRFFADYRKFLERPKYFGKQVLNYKISDEQVYEIHLDLEKFYDKKIILADRTFVEEGDEIITNAKKDDVAFLVIGDVFSATTHIHLFKQAIQDKIKVKVINNVSILTAVGITGLELYKFGKTTSMPNWVEHTNKPTSFVNYIKQNQSIDAHTLILTDIGLEIKDAIEQLQESAKNIKLPEKIIAISNAGTQNQKIFY